MADDLSRFHGLTRSQLMGRIRSRGNKKTELAMIRLLREHRIRGWRRHHSVTGVPDFAFRRERLAIFVDGCFWHGCPRHYRPPQTRASFWRNKVAANRKRDRRVDRKLRTAGWSVLRVWECHLSKRGAHLLAKRVQRALSRCQLGER